MKRRKRKIKTSLQILLLVTTFLLVLGIPSSTLVGESSGARLTGVIFDDRGVDTDGDDFFNYLELDIQVNVTEIGTYTVSVSGLLDSNSNYISIYESKTEFLDLGLQTVDVSLFGLTIYLSGLNPVNVSRIYLYDENWSNLTMSSVSNVPLSREYLYTEFDAPGASLTGDIFDKGVDTDDDDLFDYLEVSVQLNVTESGIYHVDLSGVSGLNGMNSSYIGVYDYKSEYLDIGIRVLNLSLDGPTIHASSVNPRYVNSIWLRDDNYNDLDSLSNVPLSREYSYTEFDAPPPPPPPSASLTDVIFDKGVDTDDNGLYDYLEVGVQINVTEAQTYWVEVSGLLDSSLNYSNYIDVWDSTSGYLDIGIHFLNVSLHGPAIYTSSLNPTHVSSIWLRDENYNYLSNLYYVPLSREYLYTEFDAPPPPGASLTGVIFDKGVDSDGDGAFNYLEVGVEVNVTESGMYWLSVSGLQDTAMNHISVGDYVSMYFSEGVQITNFSLNGLTIYNSGFNPSFVNYISLQDEDYNYLSSLSNVPLSREYLYTEFEFPSAALTSKIVDEGVDSDSNGFFDYLQVGVEVNVTEAGMYEVSVSSLLDAELNYIDVYASRSMYLEAGLQLVNISLHGPTIYVSGLNPRLIASCYLYDENWNWLGSIYNIPLSREYLHTEFDAPGAQLTGLIYDGGIDTDQDGLYNYLEVGVEVNVTEAGYYEVSVSDLEDSHFQHIGVYSYQSVYLNVGVHIVSLTLYGLQIYTSGLNPAYVSHIYLMDEEYRNIDSLNRVALSEEYLYTEFDPPRAVLTSLIYDWGVDTDGDGEFNYLQVGVETNVTDYGFYRVEVSGLQDSSFNHIDVWGSVSGYFDPGVHVLNVSLHGPTIRGSGLNPRYVSSIYLYDDYYSYLYSVPLSREYSYTEFDPPGAMLTTVVSDYGVDTDGDGEFNYLEVGVEIDVTEAGYYEVGVSWLLDDDHNYIGVYDSEYLYLYTGTQVVYLSLDGLQIHLSGLNPRYVNHIWLEDADYRHIGSLDDVPLSRDYSYTEFEAPSAVFTGTIYDQGIDTDDDGTFNYLVVGVEVNVSEAGYYRIEISELLDDEFNYIGVYGSVDAYLDIGTQVLNVSLSGLTIYLSSRNPRYISYISLWDQNYNQLDKLGDVPLSREYLYTEFDPPGAVLTGVIFDQGVDTDADGTYDYLQIGVEVDVADPGNYHVWVSGLLDSSFDWIDIYGSNFTYLDAGLQIVYIYLEGPRIYLSGRNPRYINYIELWDEKHTYYDSLNQVLLSREYSYKEFDPPTAMLTGRIYDRGVDTDGDGAFNYLEVGVEINVTKPGTYQAHVSELRDIYGEYIWVWSSESGYFDVGLGVLNVSLYGPSIYASRLNPRYVNYIGLSADYYSSIHDVPLSREYSYTEFDFPATLTGVISDKGVDTDADDSFDYLEVGVQVNVSDPGTYVLYVSGLLDDDSNYIDVWDSKTIYFNAGIQTVYLYLYGPQIYVTRRNPSMVSYISLTVEQYMPYYYYYDTLLNTPLSKNYSYTEFDAPFIDAEAKFVVYPDGRVTVEGALKYSNMVPKNRGPTAQGFFNFTSNGGSAQASTGLTLTLPPELATEFPYNSTTAELLAEYSNGLLNLGINSTMILPPIAKSIYPYNATDGTLTATYSGGILNIEVEGNTTLPPIAKSQFPFNATDFTMVGDYSENVLDGTITFHILPGYPFGDVDVDFTGTKTDLTLNGTVLVVFGVPFEDFIIWNSTDLDQKLDELKSTILGENGIVWNMTGGSLNVTNLDFSYVLNGLGASVTFQMDIHGDFVQALAYLMSEGRDEMLLYPVLDEAYSSAQSGSFQLTYAHTSREASIKLTFAYDLKRFVDYVLTPPAGTTPHVMMGYGMSPTLLLGDVVFVEAVANASDIIADPETGDIIAFHHPYDSRYIIIHRAINKTRVGDTWYFQTKGDANSLPDYWDGNNTHNGMISENYLIGNVSSRIPLLGYLLSYPYSVYYYGYYYPYLQSTVASRMSLLKAMFSSVENMSIQLSYSSVDKRFDFQLTLVDKLKALTDEIALIFPETFPPETPPELRSFVESLLNTTYASVSSARVSLLYEDGTADFEGTATIEGDLNAEVNFAKDLFFQLIGAQNRRYNVTVPWQLDFINQTKVDISNLKISAKLDETSVEGRFEGLIFLPPIDAVNATHFKLERFFNLTTPEYPANPFPGQDQRLRITIEGGKNATHSVVLFRPPTVPEPNITAPDRSSMVWFNQTINGLKDLVFETQLLANGTLTVTTTPVAGEVFVNDESWGTAPQSRIVEIGTYTVSFGSIEGYHTPPDQVARVYKNQEKVVEGVYTEISPGTLTVTTTPVTGEVFVNVFSWGMAPQSRLVDVGTYNVSFGRVAGYYTPIWQLATVQEDTETVVTGVYQPITGTLKITTTPVLGEVFVNGTSWGVAPQSRVVQVGTYIVSFGDMDGFYTPANQVATVSENIETTIKGVYEPVPGVVVVEEITEPELVNATNPFVVDATEEAATSLIISEISDPITVVVQNVTEPEGVAPPPGTWEVLGTYVQITVNNTDITVDATIRIYYTPEQLEASGLDESTLEIHFWNATSGVWEPVESHVNTEEHYVWAIIDHFSLFAILGEPSEGEAPLPTQLWFLAIASIVIIAVIVVSVIYIRRRKTAITHSNQKP